MNSNKRTIIFVWNYVEWGGAQIYFLAIIKAAKPEWDIVVALPRNSKPDILNYLALVGVECEFFNNSLDGSDAKSLRRKLQRQWRRINAEIETLSYLRKFDLRENILHIETAPWQSWVLLTLLSRRGANIFLTMHNFMPRSSRWRELIWKARMQFVSRLPGMHIIASNRDTKNRMKGWVSPAFWENVTVAHTAVDPVQIDAARLSPEAAMELRLRHDIPQDKTIVLAVGQFVDRKGRWVFLDAAAQVLKADPDLYFVWLTPKLPEDAERERIESYGINDSLKIVLSETLGTGRLDVLRFFNTADIFALPSYIEGLPIALLEAMAIGIPTISTRVYAIPEAVIDMKTGLLIDAGRADQLAESILKLKNDPALRQRLAASGSSFVLENFDERDAARKCLAAYKECFADGR